MSWEGGRGRFGRDLGQDGAAAGGREGGGRRRRWGETPRADRVRPRARGRGRVGARVSRVERTSICICAAARCASAFCADCAPASTDRYCSTVAMASEREVRRGW